MAVDDLKATVDELVTKVQSEANERAELEAERDMYKAHTATMAQMFSELDGELKAMWSGIDAFTTKWNGEMSKLQGLEGVSAPALSEDQAPVAPPEASDVVGP